jgi:hypothetical protein
MALTRIQKGMIADGAVTPANIETTSTFSFNKVSIPEIEVSGSSGLKINTLRANTGSWIAYYNPTSKEMTYGPIGGSTGTLQVFDQSLNTTDKVTFAGVAATTATFGGVNIANLRINNAFTMPTTAGSSGQVLTTNGSTATWSTPSTGVAGNQAVFTTSSVTFANLTVSSTATITRLVANGNTFPVGLGSNGQYLKTDGAGNLSWAPLDFSTLTNQTLLTSSTVTFKTIKTETVEGTLGVGKDLYLQTGGNGSIIMRDPTAIATVVGVYGDIIPFTHNKTTYPRNLGSALRRWQNAWIETLTVNRNTIYFEDQTANTTSTLSISTGTVYVDGAPVVDQSVTTVSSPTFVAINGTTSTFDDIIVSSELFFSDNSVQTTAWTGTVAASNVTGLATVATSGSYNDLSNKPTIYSQGSTAIFARSSLPTGTTGTIITISDSGTDTNAPAGNWAPAYWDPDNAVWTYIANSNSVTPIVTPPVTSPPVTDYIAWYDSSSFSGSTWTDLSTNTNNATVTGSPSVVSVGAGYGSSTGVSAVQGNSSAYVAIGSMPANYTIFTVARKPGIATDNGWLFTNNGSNTWLSGFAGAYAGAAYHEGWVNGYPPPTNYSDNWLISTDQNYFYRPNGNVAAQGTSGGGASPNGTWGINMRHGGSEGITDTWQVAEVVIYNRILNSTEIGNVETYLADKYGITLGA